MNKVYNLDFCFKGNRTYVHGTDIYNELCNLLESSMQAKKIDLSFHNIITHNITLTDTKPINEKLIKFICKYIDQSDIKRVLFGIVNKKSIECRYTYDEQSICNLSSLSISQEEVLLEVNSSFSFIENCVALNKYLLESIFPNVEGKWYFTRLQMKSLKNINNYPMKLNLKANFNFKLTKTEIYISDVLVGYIYFSLV